MVRYMSELDAIAPRGYSVGLHIRYASPTYVRSTYPPAWWERYNARAYGLRDPLIFWGISRTGTSRWSEITMPDPFGLIDEAAEFGLRYGVVSSCGKITSRSMVGVAREDREFTDEEMDEVARIARGLHDVSEPPRELPGPVLAALRHAARALEPDPGPKDPPDALEARLAEARDILGAETTAEAIRMARTNRLI